MNMEVITSAASEVLVNVVLAVITLAGAYAVYYIRLAGTKVKEQTSQIKDESEGARERPRRRAQPRDALGRGDGADHGPGPSRRREGRSSEP